jgi:predicted nucleic acid-binding protein
MVVRYLTWDPPELASVATEVIDGADELALTGVVIAETAWVLMKSYSIARELAVDRLLMLVRKSNIRIHGIEKRVAIEALLLCRPSGRVSVPDALLWADATMTRSSVYTLDQRFPSNGIEVRRSAEF